MLCVVTALVRADPLSFYSRQFQMRILWHVASCRWEEKLVYKSCWHYGFLEFNIHTGPAMSYSCPSLIFHWLLQSMSWSFLRTFPWLWHKSARLSCQVVHKPHCLLAVQVAPRCCVKFWKITEFTKLIRLGCLSGSLYTNCMCMLELFAQSTFLVISLRAEMWRCRQCLSQTFTFLWALPHVVCYRVWNSCDNCCVVCCIVPNWHKLGNRSG